MRSARFDHVLTGTAVAFALTLAGSSTALAQSTRQTNAIAPASQRTATPPAASEATPAAIVNEPAATNTSPTPEPVTTTASPDTQLTDKLKEMTAGKFDKILGGKKERTGFETFYASRNFAPLWISGGALNDRAKAAIAFLASVDADGLDPADYPAPQIRAGADVDALADAELRFTDTIMTYARHALNGRIHYTRVSGDILYEQLVRPEPVDVLAKLANAGDIRAALDGFQPQLPAYKALKAKLTDARANKNAGPARISTSGPVLKYAKDKKGQDVLMSDERVPLVRERLGLEASGDTNFDKALADAVLKFQKSHGIAPSGQLTAATIEAINGPKRDRDADIIIVNMERWRWVPRDLGKDYVMVNIPEYRLRLMHDGELYWTTKVVVGKPNMATPIITAEMKFITVNPTWNVPPSIIQNEYLPALANDPQAMERIGLKVETARDGTVRIWQPPGDRNALGRMRFNFPNKFLVYQHDTPDKNYFAHDKRAYSHGCMRVENPTMYGEKLLSLVLPNENYTAERLRKMFGSSEVNINFPTVIPVHLTYQTAYVNGTGELQIFDDIYGRDAKMLAMLKGSERKMADVAIERVKGTPSKPVRAPNSMFSGPSFFEKLFGAPTPAAPVRRTSAARPPQGTFR